MTRLTTLVLFLCGLLCAATVSARILNVPEDHESIQGGINASDDGDTVLVQPGDYNESIRFGGRHVTVASRYLLTKDEADIAATIIRGRAGEHVVSFHNQEDRGAILIGFTITGGRAELGAGIEIFDGSPTLSHLIVEDCVAEWDGGGNYEGYGAGIFIFTANPIISHTIVRDCHAGFNGGGICLIGSNATLEYVSVTSNTAWHSGAGLYFDFCNQPTLRNLTVADNSLDDDELRGGGMLLNRSSVSMTNTIVYYNQPDNIELYVEDNLPTSSLDAAWIDLENGIEGIVNRNEDVNFRGENLEADPLFIDRENGNYRLSEDSPCIDAGDPESAADSDWSRVDMGAFPFVHRGGFIGGVVLDRRTNEPIANAELRAVEVVINEVPCDVILRSDDRGLWGGWLNIVFRDTILFNFDITAPQHSHSSLEARLVPNDSVWIEVHLGAAGFVPSDDSVAVEVDSSGVAEIPFTIQNDGDGALQWSAIGRPTGNAGVTPWTLRQTLTVGLTTGDDRIEGVAFDGERFYASGANGADSSLIYILDRDGALVDSFPQATHSRYGMKDLDWDGDLLWGSGDTLIYGIERDGQLRHRWRGPHNPTNAVAVDPDEGILWLAGTTTNISGYDQDGNNLGLWLSRMALRIYGLAWYADDPDGYCLYILNYPSPGAACIYKMNVRTNDTLKVTDLELPVGTTGVGGGFICNNYDRYRSAVFISTVNVTPGDGSDLIQVRQLEPNREWLSTDPSEGEVPAGESRQIDIIFRTTALDNDWTFSTGVYEGEIVFTHDGRGEQMIIPIYLTVQQPDFTEPTETIAPSAFGFTNLYPQPSNSSLTIGYHLNQADYIQITLTDVTGREFTVINLGYSLAGDHAITTDLVALPSGVYLLKLKSAKRTSVSKVVLIK